MKKLFTAMAFVLGLGLATAQQTAPVKKAASSQTVKTVKARQPAATPAAAKLKKDGTPDKRYKENKKLKKDGTPDKRYK
ncbi:hypothetical protein [uncultured Chryseobacterium sp.]|uniref:hypothetical protein n=1 Tax=uncultured Chryseobacterium sp. TaxID=259322 RepID=UPI0025F42A47|nr:hypothetical protein [uncultured Chryseobacterium sp.]